MWATNFKVDRVPSSNKVSAKEKYDSHGNPWGQGTDTCRRLPFLWNCEEVGYINQAGHTRLLSVRSSKSFSHRWTSWNHSPYGFVLNNSCLTVQQIAKFIGISFGSVNTVFTEILEMSTLFTRWVTRILTLVYKLKIVDISRTPMNPFQTKPKLSTTD